MKNAYTLLFCSIMFLIVESCKKNTAEEATVLPQPVVVPKIILPGSWLQKADAPFLPRYLACGFSIGSKGYVGAGQTPDTGSVSYFTDWWEYDPTADHWTSRASIPFSNGFWAGVSFVINDKGYLGIGNTDSVLTKQLWQYDATANSWTRKTDFPGNWKSGAIGLSIGNKGYVGLGANNNDSVNNPQYPTGGRDWWEYDPAIDQWTQKSDFPGPSKEFLIGLVINNKIYLGLGEVYGGNFASWWEYDPAADHWTQKSDWPGLGAEDGGYLAGFTIANKGYVVGQTKCWAYDPALDSWTQQAFCTDLRSHGVAFSIAGQGYFTTGWNVLNNYQTQNDLWEFTPPRNMNW
ncbi:MAG: hypothetical protein ABIY90_16680 [Puia sp.]